MKRILSILILCFFGILSCQTKIPYFKNTVSKRNVTITMREVNKENVYILNIPIEFELNLNRKEIKDVGIYYDNNNKRVQYPFDYLVYDGETNKVLFAIEDLKYDSYPNSIYIVDGLNILTYEQAVELLKKYNVDKSLSKLKTKTDTIPLTPYKKFREDFPDFINKMKEIPDTLRLSIGFSNGIEEVFEEQIKW